MRDARNIATFTTESVTNNSPDQIDAARLVICEHAVDVEEARLLLDMLGVHP